MTCGVCVAGINHKVRYALRDSLGHFQIDPVSGIISLTRELDREQQPQFNLTIYAYDQVSGGNKQDHSMDIRCSSQAQDVG